MADIIETTLTLRDSDGLNEEWQLVDDAGDSEVNAGDGLVLEVLASPAEDAVVLIDCRMGASDTTTTGISGLDLATGKFQVSIIKASLVAIPGARPLRLWHRFRQVYSDFRERRIRHGACDILP